MGISLIKRRVSADTDFSADTKRQVFAAQNGICAICRDKPATEYDHILALEFGDIPEAAQMLPGRWSDESNCSALCWHCHNAKSTAEKYINSAVMTSELARHYAKYYRAAFTPSGKRRTIKAATLASLAPRLNDIKAAKAEVSFFKMLIETGQYKPIGKGKKVHGNNREAFRNASIDQIEAALHRARKRYAAAKR